MADNPPAPTPPPNPGPRPTLPGTGLTGRLKLTTTQPTAKKPGGGKIVVMLSSVAKAPPVGTQALPRVAPAPEPAPKPPVVESAPAAKPPPPLPPKQVSPANHPPAPSRPQLSATTYVKLPPKTSVPGWSSLSGKPVAVPGPTIVTSTASTPPPPLLPPKTVEPKKVGAQHIPPIKLNEPSPEESQAEGESIFLQKQPESAPKPEGVKTPAPAAPVAARPPSEAPMSLDLFEQSQATPIKPALPPSMPEAKKTPDAKKISASLVAPALIPPQRFAGAPLMTAPMPSVRPPPLPAPVAKAPEPVVPTAPPPLNIAPPMLAKAPEPELEKLPPPVMVKPVEPVAATVVPTLHIAPPMLEKAPEPQAEKLPPPVMVKPVEPVVPSLPPPLHIAPPLLEQPVEPPAEKLLPQPHLSVPVEARKPEPPASLPESPGIAKVPALITPETPPPKPLLPPTTVPAPKKSITGWLKKTVPLVVSSTAKPAPPPIAEAKPALKSPVLPSRLQPPQAPVANPVPVVESKLPPPIEPPKAIEALAEAKVAEKIESKVETPAGPGTTPSVVAPVAPSSASTSDDSAVKKSAAKAPSTPAPAAKVAVPLTRAERAKRRQFWSTVAFWGAIFPISIAALFFASLHFGRDTRVEGQVIPPPGMVLNDEVWIVTDFRSLASGIAEDLAAERAPLRQEIQERQDHVQRATADVASREERIRLIQEEIGASKDAIDLIVKQARDATQKIWDVDGAAIDAEYTERQNQLQQTIADRAKSLKLNYQPDPQFNSPEVWANAYRLALYQVPAGVDGVKEHAWLGDQMKAWRDYEKSLDDRKEQLREKAAQIKLGPAPKIADLNAKIDDLQQRSDATAAEEIPLKGELQQAEADLTAAQAADAGLDDKYYKQLDSLPAEAIVKRIPLRPNGRFTWVDDNVFVEGDNEHNYYIFARATRPDGRQYWALGQFGIKQFYVRPLLMDPTSFVSTKAILRPDLSPDEQQQ